MWDYKSAQLLRKAIEAPNKFAKTFERYVYNEFLRDKANFLNAIKSRDLNLVVGYTRLADDLGHLYGGNLTKTFEIYSLLDNFAKEVKALVDEDDVLLIVSDHGMKPLGRYGEHSNHGFYSCNKKLNLKNPRIYDFFPIIVNDLEKS